MVYTPTGGEFTIDTSSLKAPRLRASWFDPTTGVYTPFSMTTSSNKQATFTPPKEIGHADWVLVLEGGS
jgi:hypothetical protein